jgi:hypothetical protein
MLPWCYFCCFIWSWVYVEINQYTYPNFNKGSGIFLHTYISDRCTSYLNKAVHVAWWTVSSAHFPSNSAILKVGLVLAKRHVQSHHRATCFSNCHLLLSYWCSSFSWSFLLIGCVSDLTVWWHNWIARLIAGSRDATMAARHTTCSRRRIGTPTSSSDRCWRCSAMVEYWSSCPHRRPQAPNGSGVLAFIGDSVSSAVVQFSLALLPRGLAGYHNAPEKF